MVVMFCPNMAGNGRPFTRQEDALGSSSMNVPEADCWNSSRQGSNGAANCNLLLHDSALRQRGNEDSPKSS